tara:strand:+ start:110 stop:463 length:354 start_codon:yes stop_codon:yes gene_type:complete
MAMALFAIAGVSLARAITLISLTVSESIEDAAVREQLRAVLLEVSRSPNLIEDSRTTSPDDAGISYEIEVEPLTLSNFDDLTLKDLFEVRVTAFRSVAGRQRETIESANTWVYSKMF